MISTVSAHTSFTPSKESWNHIQSEIAKKIDSLIADVLIHLPKEDYRCCPISTQIFYEPVIEPLCGQSFEKKEIFRWLKITSTCPFCRQSVKPEDLTPNKSLEDACNELRQETELPYLQIKEKISSLNPENFTEATDIIKELNHPIFNSMLKILEGLSVNIEHALSLEITEERDAKFLLRQIIFLTPANSLAYDLLLPKIQSIKKKRDLLLEGARLSFKAGNPEFCKTLTQKFLSIPFRITPDIWGNLELIKEMMPWPEEMESYILEKGRQNLVIFPCSFEVEHHNTWEKISLQLLPSLDGIPIDYSPDAKFVETRKKPHQGIYWGVIEKKMVKHTGNKTAEEQHQKMKEHDLSTPTSLELALAFSFYKKNSGKTFFHNHRVRARSSDEIRHAIVTVSQSPHIKIDLGSADRERETVAIGIKRFYFSSSSISSSASSSFSTSVSGSGVNSSLATT